MTENDVILAFLIANERSGTHLLRSMLRSSGIIMAPGELCNASAEAADLANPTSFFYFKYKAMQLDSRLIYPTSESNEKLLDEYFEMLRGLARERHSRAFLCDIKYSHVHNFNEFWWDWVSMPSLFNYARGEGIPIIHLVRQNSYQTAFSQIYATETGVWEASAEGDIVNKRIHVDVDDLKARAERFRQVIALARDWLKSCNTLEITYEDISGPNYSRVVDTVMQFLGFEGLATVNIDSLKTTPPYEAIIENYSEVNYLLEPE